MTPVVPAGALTQVQKRRSSGCPRTCRFACGVAGGVASHRRVMLRFALSCTAASRSSATSCAPGPSSRTWSARARTRAKCLSGPRACSGCEAACPLEGDAECIGATWCSARRPGRGPSRHQTATCTHVRIYETLAGWILVPGHCVLEPEVPVNLIAASGLGLDRELEDSYYSQ